MSSNHSFKKFLANTLLVIFFLVSNVTPALPATPSSPYLDESNSNDSAQASLIREQISDASEARILSSFEQDMADTPAESEQNDFSEAYLVDIFQGKSLLLDLPSREMMIREGDNLTRLGLFALSAKFLPTGEIIYIDDLMGLYLYSQGDVREILPSQSANGPLFVSKDGSSIAYLKPSDFQGGNIPDTNGIVVMDLIDYTEHEIYQIPGLTIFLYGWSGDSLVVEVPYWSSTTLQPADRLNLGLISTSNPQNEIAPFASLPRLLPNSSNPKTQFDQRYIAYQSLEGVVVASLENPEYTVLSDASEPRWVANGLRVKEQDSLSVKSLSDVVMTDNAPVPDRIPIPDLSPQEPDVINQIVTQDNNQPDQTAAVVLYRPVPAATGISYYFDNNPTTGAWLTYWGLSGTTYKYGGSYDGHKGTDYDGADKDPIYASQTGTVTNLGIYCGNTYPEGPIIYGTNLRIVHGTLSDGNYYATGYAHLNCEAENLFVNDGSVISVLPRKIALMGDSGYADGFHLHLNVRKTTSLALIDPYKYGIMSADLATGTVSSPPPQPTITSILPSLYTRMFINWSTPINPDEFKIYSPTNGQTYTISGSNRYYIVQDLQCNKVYEFKLWAVKSGVESTRASASAKTNNCPGANAKITNVQFSPVMLRSGEVLTVTFTVQNIGSTVIRTQGPNPGFQYTEGQSATSVGYPGEYGKFRVGIGCNGPTGCNDYPYRWGLGQDLAPGQTVTVVGKIRLNTVRTINYMAGLFEQSVKPHQRDVFSTGITVNPATVSCNDSYEPNETLYQSKYVSIVSTIQAYICDTKDLDWFYVYAPFSGKLIVDLTNIPSGTDYDISLYSASGFLTSSFKGGSYPEHIEWSVSGGKTYYVKIYSYAGSSVSSAYSLRFQLVTQTSDNPGVEILSDEQIHENYSAWITNHLERDRQDEQALIPEGIKYLDSLWPLSLETTEYLGAFAYVSVYHEGVTPAVGPGSGITCYLHRGQVDYWGGPWYNTTDSPMTYLGDWDAWDEYYVEFYPSEGTYEYTAYCDIDGELVWEDTSGQLIVYPISTTLVYTYPSDAGIVDPGTGQYSGPTQFTATPNAGYEFERWWIYRDGNTQFSYSNPLSLDIGLEDLIIEADFRPIGAGIYGRVNLNGWGEAGIPLELRFYDGIAFSTILTTTTSDDGSYNFMGAPSLGTNQLYYIRYLNDTGNMDYLYGWWGSYLSQYQAGESLRGGDFDLRDVTLGLPNSLEDHYFPTEFNWTARDIYPEEAYGIEIYGEQLYWGPFQQGVYSYYMDAIPPELRTGEDLWWDILVSTADGVGISWGLNEVRFATGGGNLSGYVTYEGNPDPGNNVGLWFYDGIEWQVIDWTVSNEEGVYQFSRLPALQQDQAYATFYLNFDDPEKPNRIWYGDCYIVTTYDVDAYNYACDIETEDVFLEGPYVLSESFPVRFNWSPRDTLFYEEFELRVYDFEAGQQYIAPAADNISEYTISSLPTGFTGRDFFWEVWTYNDQGRTISYAINHVNGPYLSLLPLIFRTPNGVVNSIEVPVIDQSQPQSEPYSRDLHPIMQPQRFQNRDFLLQENVENRLFENSRLMDGFRHHGR